MINKISLYDFFDNKKYVILLLRYFDTFNLAKHKLKLDTNKNKCHYSEPEVSLEADIYILKN